MENKLEIGDEVKIVKYGSLLWTGKNLDSWLSAFPLVFETDTLKFYDITPQLVGKTGMVEKIKDDQYSLSGIPEKVAWYDRQQLEKIDNGKSKHV